jgi:hypothetical protein
MGNRLIHGVGVFDVKYSQSGMKNRAYKLAFMKWRAMIYRCYVRDENSNKYVYNYDGCTVCDEWLIFSGFLKWIRKFDFEGMHIDKDIIKEGNKVYCPEFCCIVEPSLNYFLTDDRAKRGDQPIGVHLEKETGKFKASCRNPFTKKKETLGRFKDPDSAHKAWRKRKHEIALEWAIMQKDERVKQALMTRFA